MVRGARNPIEKTDILIAAGEQPEVVALTEVLLAEHALEARPLRCELLQIRRVVAAEDLFVIFVLFDHDYDMVIDRQRRRPG